MKGTRRGSPEYYLLKHQNELLGIRPAAWYRDQGGKKQLIFDPMAPRSCVNGLKRRMNRYELWKTLLDINSDLRKAYHFRNRLSEDYRKENLSTAEEELRSLIKDLDSTGVDELQSFADTLRNWFREIVNSFQIIKQEYVVDAKTGNVRLKEHRLTSSMIENRNKIMKMIKHNANGYTSWERFRNRVLYVLSRGPEDGHSDRRDKAVNSRRNSSK